jgi:hypothetical protein
MADLDPEYKKRLILVYDYIKQFTLLNTYYMREHVVGEAEADLKFMHSATQIVLDVLASVYTFPGALVLWEDLWAEVKIDLNQLCSDVPYAEDEGILCIYNAEYLERYQSKANVILLEMDITP